MLRRPGAGANSLLDQTEFCTHWIYTMELYVLYLPDRVLEKAPCGFPEIKRCQTHQNGNGDKIRKENYNRRSENIAFSATDKSLALQMWRECLFIYKYHSLAPDSRGRLRQYTSRR